MILISSVIMLCWTRLIFTPTGFISLLTFISLTYLFNTLFLLIHLKNKPPSWTKKYSALALLFSTICISGLFGGFITKDMWLGVHVYRVINASMEPTLKAGQFILIDTWAYREKAPSLNDIVIFEQDYKRMHLIKRIQRWPNGKLTNNKLWYVIGDNRKFSLDSRYFGGIAKEQIIGQVKLIIEGVQNSVSA